MARLEAAVATATADLRSLREELAAAKAAEPVIQGTPDTPPVDPVAPRRSNFREFFGGIE